MAMVELKNIRKKLGGVDILNGVDLSVEEGEVVVILGTLRFRKNHPFADHQFPWPCRCGNHNG